MGFLQKIRQNRFFTHTPIVLITEAVADVAGSRMEVYSRIDPLVLSMRESGVKGQRAGVGKAQAEDMVFLLSHHLAMDSIVFSDQFITYDKKTDKVKEMLAKQLRTYQYHKDPKGKIKLDGKVSH